MGRNSSEDEEISDDIDSTDSTEDTDAEDSAEEYDGEYDEYDNENSEEDEDAILRELGIDLELENTFCPHTGNSFTIFDRIFPIHVFPKNARSYVTSYSWSEDVEMEMEDFMEGFLDNMRDTLGLDESCKLLEMELSAEQKNMLSEDYQELLEFAKKARTIRITWGFESGEGCIFDEVELIENNEPVETSQNILESLQEYAEQWVSNYGWEYGP